MISAITNNKRLDGSAVEESHNVKSEIRQAIPQDKKFSTGIAKLPGPCSRQSQRSRH